MWMLFIKKGYEKKTTVIYSSIKILILLRYIKVKIQPNPNPTRV